MRAEPDAKWEEPIVENLPTPGALRQWGHLWVPTLDGEPIGAAELFGFETRQEAWEEAIRWVKYRAGLAIEVRLGRRTGCVVTGDDVVIVETVAEAREAILHHAMNSLGDQGDNPEYRKYLRLRSGRGSPSWEDLTRCETDRRYDPDDPSAGLRCGYVLFEQGGLDGVGGLVWTYGVYIWATAPPEVWDHPADQPCGLETENDLPEI